MGKPGYTTTAQDNVLYGMDSGFWGSVSPQNAVKAGGLTGAAAWLTGGTLSYTHEAGGWPDRFAQIPTVFRWTRNVTDTYGKMPTGPCGSWNVHKCEAKHCKGEHCSMYRARMIHAMIFFFAMTSGCTPALHRAARDNDVGKINALLQRGYGIDERSKCDFGSEYTPLHYAAANGSIRAMEFLLERGADIKAGAGGGQTPLQAACGLFYTPFRPFRVFRGQYT